MTDDDYTPSLDDGREAYRRFNRDRDREHLWPTQDAESDAEWHRMIEAVRAEEREKAAQIVLVFDGFDAVTVGQITRHSIATRIRAQGE